MRYLHEMLQWFGAFVCRPLPTRNGGTVHDVHNPLSPRGMLRVGGAFSLIMASLIFSSPANADCYYTSGTAATISFPSQTINISPDTPLGPLTTYVSNPITPPNPYLTLDCTSATSSGIVNAIGGQSSGSDDTLFPTNIPWLSYRILHPDTASPLSASPNQSVSTGSVQFSIASALQLVVTGPVTTSGQISGQLGIWQTTYCTRFSTSFFGTPYNCRASGTYPIATFTTGTIKFVLPACTTGSTNFMLPTVLTSSFSGINSTTGQSPFNVSFTCSASTKVSITLATNSAATGVTGSGVIAPTSGGGYAQGVGVQILDTPTHAITFGTPVSAGTVSSGVVSVPFYARYYQTSNTVTGGNVKALATYTLTYQ